MNAAIQEIFDAIGREFVSADMQLMRGINHWDLGALAPAADPNYRTSFLEHVPESARTLAPASAWLADPDAGGGVDRP